MQYFFNVTSFLFLTKMNTSFLLLFSFFFSTSYIYIVSTIDAIRHSHLFSQEKSFLRVFFYSPGTRTCIQSILSIGSTEKCAPDIRETCIQQTTDRAPRFFFPSSCLSQDCSHIRTHARIHFVSFFFFEIVHVCTCDSRFDRMYPFMVFTSLQCS